jgi:hypothetical protein
VPSYDYDALHAVAENLLEKFGDYGTLTKQSFTTADSTKPWDRTATSSDSQILMVVVPWSRDDEGRYFSQDIIRRTSKAIVLWDDASKTAVDDQITFDGIKYMNAAQVPINPAGTGMIFICALSGVAE